MFTTGSKLLLGGTVLAIVAAVVIGVTTGGVVGWTATISLIGAAAGLALLAGVNVYTRDSNVSSMDTLAAAESAAAQAPPTRSTWPLVGAVGAALLTIGVVSAPVVFKAGVVVVLAAMFEWMILAWSDRASADSSYNSQVRSRLLHPLEFPILAALGAAVIVYSFSRIMLFISKSTGPAIFGIIAALVLFGGILLAYSPSLKKSVALGVCVIAGLGLVSTGAVMAIGGEREIEAHEIIAKDPSVCSSNEETEADHHASQTVAAKSSVAAEITFRDGALVAHQMGAGSVIAQVGNTITLQRANPSIVLFHNDGDEEVRLVAHLGAFTSTANGTPVTEKPVTCTTLVEHGGTGILTLRIPQSSAASAEPYTLAVPGVDSAVTVEVP